ncbi:MAG: PAS domain-containing protein [Paracoccaceae bacterium]
MINSQTGPVRPEEDAGALPLLDGLGEGFALSVLDSSPDCIKLIELDGRLSFMNRNGLCAMEIDDFCTIEGQAWTTLWPVESQAMLHEAMRAAASGQTTSFEAFCPTAKGSERWWQVTVSPIYAGGGGVERILSTSRDVTERVVALRRLKERDLVLQETARQLQTELAEKNALLERQKVLLGEIDHRVKNSFALIAGVLRLQLAELTSKEAREAVQDAANRIASLSKVHEQLHINPEDRHVALADYMASLLAGLESSVSRGAPSDPIIRFKGTAAIQIAADSAIAIGLLVTELVGNALKHGGDGVKVTVEILPHPEDEARLMCRVTDTGRGLEAGFDPMAQSGLGMKICNAYSAQLGGRIKTGVAPEGGAMFAFGFLP